MVNGVKNVINLLDLPGKGSLGWVWVVEFGQDFGFVGSGDEGDDLVVVMALFEVLKLLVYDLRVSDFIPYHGIQNLQVYFFLDPGTDMLHELLILGLVVVHTYFC